MSFTSNLPIKKSEKEIEQYIKNGKLFGEFLKLIHWKISSGNVWTSGMIEYEFETFVMSIDISTDIQERKLFPFSSQKNSRGQIFNHYICVSVNDCVAHGYYKKDFAEGDIISADFGFIDELGLHYDAAITAVYKVKDEESWITAPLRALKDIVTRQPEDTQGVSDVIENRCDTEGLSTVLALSGHGIGHSLHEPPTIYNAKGQFANEPMFDGFVFCAEPIFSLKKHKADTIIKTYIDSDGWSIYTRDKRPTSHWETMFAVKDGRIVDLTGMTEWSFE